MRKPNARLHAEQLEDRRLLTIFAVTSLLDGPVAAAEDLPGSLRQAIFDANAAEGPDVIEFADGLSGTIELNAGQLAVGDALTIDGPSNRSITVSGSNNSRVFLVSQTSLAINDLSIVDGRATDFPVPLPPDAPPMAMGGGILNLSGSVELSGTHFEGHETADGALGGGGAISSVFGASLEVDSSSFKDNHSFGVVLGVGGAILNDGASIMTIRNSDFSGNEATSGIGTDPTDPFIGFGTGGAIVTAGGSVTKVYGAEFHANRSTGVNGAPGMEAGANGADAGVGIGGAIAATGITLIGTPARSTLYVADSLFQENVVTGGNGGAGAANGSGGIGGAANGSALNLFGDIEATVVRSQFIGNQAISGRGGDGGTGGNGGNGAEFTGGVILATGADLTVVNSEFRENFSQGASGGNGGVGGNGGNASIGIGGGVIVSNFDVDPTLPASARIISSDFVDNVAIGGNAGLGGEGETANGRSGAARGGAIGVNAGESTAGMNQGPVSLMSANNNIMGNVAQGGAGPVGGNAIGGGIAAFANQLAELATVKIRNTKVVDNSAIGGLGSVEHGHGEGGGIFNDVVMDIGSRDIDHVFGNSSDGCLDLYLDAICFEDGTDNLNPEAEAAAALVGDLNDDGIVGIPDVEILNRAIKANNQDSEFDLNMDELVSSADMQFLSQIEGVTPGDANFDGVVDFIDFLVLTDNFGKDEGGITWSQGDFNGDGTVNFNDFLILANNFG